MTDVRFLQKGLSEAKIMTYYAWTISRPGKRDINEVTPLLQLQDVLRTLDLFGTTVFTKMVLKLPDNGTYTHNKGSMDERSLTWRKIGDTSIVVEFPIK
ncbi:hypothetical protein [Rhizobium herbae]